MTNCNGFLFSSDHFVVEWIQATDLKGKDILPENNPIKLRITKQDVFYVVEIADKNDTIQTYPDQSGRYELSYDKKTYII